MTRFYTIIELRRMSTTERIAVTLSIVFIQAVGVALSVLAYQKGWGYMSVVPFLGLTVIAWDRKG